MKKLIYTFKAFYTPQNSILISAFINTAYAVFNFGVGWWNSSPWYVSVGAYYLLLCLIRFFILKEAGTANKKLSEERMRFELKIYRAVGVIMFFVNIAMSVMAVQMIWQDGGTVHSEIMTIAMATFTFYFLTVAIINLQKYRKTQQPIHSAAKMLNFACALMSVFTLQNTMLSAFGGGDIVKPMNIATGSAVFILVFGLAIYMIRRGNKLLRKMKEDNNG